MIDRGHPVVEHRGPRRAFEGGFVFRDGHAREVVLDECSGPGIRAGTRVPISESWDLDKEVHLRIRSSRTPASGSPT